MTLSGNLGPVDFFVCLFVGWFFIFKAGNPDLHVKPDDFEILVQNFENNKNDKHKLSTKLKKIYLSYFQLWYLFFMDSLTHKSLSLFGLCKTL